MTSHYTWALLALAAAALWGLQYALWGHVAKNMDVASTMFWYSVLTTIIFGMAVVIRGHGFEIKRLLATPTLGIMLVVALIGALANLGIIGSMQLKNATVASMIECSYPVFTGLFTWLLFRNLQFNAVMLLGLLCVLVDVGLVALAQE